MRLTGGFSTPDGESTREAAHHNLRASGCNCLNPQTSTVTSVLSRWLRTENGVAIRRRRCRRHGGARRSI